MLLVGAVDQSALLCPFSQHADFINALAPGAGWGISAPRALKNGNAVVNYMVDDVTGELKKDGAGNPLLFKGTSFGEQMHG